MPPQVVGGTFTKAIEEIDGSRFREVSNDEVVFKIHIVIVS
jgi:hypothetical protein